MMLRFISFSLMVCVLAACGAGEARYPTGADRASTGGDIYAEEPSIFGAGGISRVFGLGDEQASGETGIGVNSYLWRASLDTVSFMPLDSADPFGGVITTNWYEPLETPGERLKLNIVILSKKLTSDGIRVSVFKQRNSGGTWQDMPVDPQTATQLEDAILTRARQLKVADIQE